MKASIIIPSYNASERLYYNLLSLNMQSCDRDSFEVIVVDNASKDSTKSLLLNFQANFKLKLIFLNENKGRAYARNCAVDKSEGKILIFHDSDMIAEKDYISKHIAAHNQNNTVVMGKNWDRIYTYFYKNFKGYLKENFKGQMKKKANVKYQGYTDLQPIVSEEDIINGKCFEYGFVLFDYQNAEDEILKNYGNQMDGYKFPWSLFATNNCSASREDILKAGAFDNAFITWGCEDQDLGYRLYKNGCHFIKDNDIVSLHQEHPINFCQKGLENVYYITNKYNNIDILLFYYGFLASINRQHANIILNEIEKLKENDRLTWFIELYRRLLINLRDKSYGNDRNRNIQCSKALRQYFLSKADDFKDALYELEMDKEYSAVIHSYRTLLKCNFGTLIKKVKV